MTVLMWSFLPLVCLMVDHLLCPDCSIELVANMRRHLGHIAPDRAGRASAELRSLKPGAIGSRE